MDVRLAADINFVRTFLDTYHPLRAGGALKGLRYAFVGCEDEWPVMLAVFCTPRSRWKRKNVVLELSRLAWSPIARHSTSTFLRKCLRLLKAHGISGCVVTYAMPGTSGLVYERAGFGRYGMSSGAWRSRTGPNRKPRPDTVGSGVRLARFIYCIGER